MRKGALRAMSAGIYQGREKGKGDLREGLTRWGENITSKKRRE